MLQFQLGIKRRPCRSASGGSRETRESLMFIEEAQAQTLKGRVQTYRQEKCERNEQKDIRPDRLALRERQGFGLKDSGVCGLNVHE